MRYRLLSAIFAAAAIGLMGQVGQAEAQTGQFNCAMLSGTPFMCIKNESSSPVLAIQAIAGMSFQPNAWITIPGGGVMPGGAAVIKFPAYKGCTQTIFVRTADGTPHTFANVDVCHSTSLTIRW